MAGRVFLITGATSGMGLATARRAVADGFRVALAARSQDGIDELVRELGGPTHAVGIRCDVSNWDDVLNMVATTLDAFGAIDIVLANAGFKAGGEFLGGPDTPDEWRSMVLTNVYGTALTVRATLPELVARRGHLLFTGSIVGIVSIAGELYSPTKWAVSAMAESVRQQLVGTGVRTTLIVPGVTATNFHSDPESVADVPQLTAAAVADTIMWTVSQPASSDVNQVVVRPVGERI